MTETDYDTPDIVAGFNLAKLRQALAHRRAMGEMRPVEILVSESVHKALKASGLLVDGKLEGCRVVNEREGQVFEIHAQPYLGALPRVEDFTTPVDDQANLRNQLRDKERRRRKGKGK